MVAALADLPNNRPVRILEIGAGTGATTSYLLPRLPAGQTEYLFTDLSPLFTSRAAEKFKSYPFVQYGLLDIEQDPAGQGLAARQFDLIVAANVLHATADLRRTLAHIRQLLAPNGLVVLLEGAKPQRWVDLTFGLTEGWWKFSDTDLRPDYPLLSPQQWLALLQELGFAAVAIPTEQAEKTLPEQMVVVAKATQVEPAAAELAGSWLIFTDRQGLGQALAQQLELAGGRCRFVWPGQQYAALAEGWQVDPARPEDFRRLVAEALTGQPAWQGVIHLWSLDAGSPADLSLAALEAAQQLTCGSVLHLVQALAQTEAIKTLPLWLVTSGAQPVGSETVSITQTPLWGLGRVVALEHPELWGGLIDLDPAIGPVENAKSLAAELAQPDGEDQVAWRAGQRLIARLVRTPNLKPQPVSCRPDSAYLVTGGLGGLGLKVAYWLAEQGARYIVLLGRRGLPEREQWAAVAPDSETGRRIAAVQAIEALGATVVVEPADVGNLSRMQALFEQFGRTAPPLRGIIHAAAALSAWSLKEMPLPALQDMLKPKMAGTWILHQLSQEMALDFFGLFSSTTALWGSARLGHYAAANQFLDGFAHYRQALGLPAVSINWGTWDEMRVASSTEQQMAAQTGLNRMLAEQALAHLGDFLGTATPQVTVASVDWAALKAVYEAKRPRPLFEYLEAPAMESKRNGTAPKQAAESSELLRQWAAARPDQRQDILIGHIQREVARVLGLDPAQPSDLHRGLFELGLDSLMSVELKSRLESCVEQSLPSTLIFNYPTIADLAGYLSTLLNSAPAEPSTETSAAQPAPAHIEPVTESANGAAHTDPDDLSEDELAALLLRKLEQLQ
jgi:NAD(P)-dependent dehydrogenase (short-subunit alcohol dehydrogenase family)/SAM-dependent methyltransferase/acyl carrier protein